MIESFYIEKNRAFVQRRLEEKSAIAFEIMTRPARRIFSPDPIKSRTRLDLMWDSGKIGVRGPFKANMQFDFEEIQNPDTAAEPIIELIQWIYDNPPPLGLSQFRFKSNVEKKLSGLWIDTSNENIKSLLDENQWILKFLESGRVLELGQKHKEAKITSGGIEFSEATPRPWLESYDESNNEIPLLSTLSVFSQPGPEVNRALIAVAFELLDDFSVPKGLSWVEWGAGYGNLSFAFASKLGDQAAHASEADPHAFELLSKNATLFLPKLQVSQQRATDALEADFWLLDPPRSGFTELLENLATFNKKPRYVFCYHCHQSGLIKDTRALKKAGYSLKDWSAVDAFPGTTHLEVLSLWSL